jgi:hypothetical protein
MPSFGVFSLKNGFICIFIEKIEENGKYATPRLKKNPPPIFSEIDTTDYVDVNTYCFGIIANSQSRHL